MVTNKKFLLKFAFISAGIAVLIFVADLFFADSLDTNIIDWKRDHPSFKIRYFVPYTGGGTSECYPLSLSYFNVGQKVTIKRSIFYDVCFVFSRNRDAIEKEFGSWLDRHIIED